MKGLGRRQVSLVPADSQHAEDVDYDARRDAELRRHGFRILRVWNSELTTNRDGVLESILAALQAD